jgi:hypothetical protein
MWVDFTTERGEVVDYVVVLLVSAAADVKAVRVYDSAHGFNEMHRYTLAGGKQEGTEFHTGSLGEGLRVAMEDTKLGYVGMIEGWRGG